LQELLDSVQKQSLLPSELIWCDDGSADATREIAEKFKEAAPFPVEFSVNGQNLGPMQNFAYALSKVNGTHVALCDQDDVWLPQKLEQLLDEFGDAATKLAYSDSLLVDENLNSLGGTFLEQRGNRHVKKDSLSFLLFQNTVSGCVSLFDADLLRIALPIPDVAIMHDWWITLVASIAGNVKHVKEITTLYRQHGENVIGGGERYTLRSLHESGIPFRMWSRAKRKFTISANQAIALRERLEEIGVEAPEPLSRFVMALGRSRLELWRTCRKFDIQRGDWSRNLYFTLGLLAHDPTELIRSK
jgi:glycosyltransferase involved in cell wall biosynthesis